MKELTYLIYAIFWLSLTIGGAGYAIFWLGYSGWWMLAGLLIACFMIEPKSWFNGVTDED